MCAYALAQQKAKAMTKSQEVCLLTLLGLALAGCWKKDNLGPLTKADTSQKKCRAIPLKATEYKLIDAVRSGNLEEVKEYMRYKTNRKRKKELKAKNWYGKTALHIAVEAGNKEIVDFLLKEGADINAQDSKERTPLMAAFAIATSEKKSDDFKKKRDEIVATLVQKLEKKGELKKALKQKDNQGKTLLMFACAQGRHEIVRKLVQKLKGKGNLKKALEKKDEQGRTPLMFAIMQGNDGIVNMLLNELGGKRTFRYPIEQKDNHNKTLLHYAAAQGSMTVMKRLVDCMGGRATIKNGLATKDKAEQTPMHLAAQKGHVAIINFLKLEGAGVEVKDNKGKKPLHYAVEHKHINAVSALIDAGAKVYSADKERKIPLHYVFKLEDSPEEKIKTIIEKLLQKSASINARPINARDKEGKTPLHYAMEKGTTKVATMLARKGASIKEADRNRKTPIHYAVENEKAETIIEVLKPLNKSYIEDALYLKDNKKKTPGSYIVNNIGTMASVITYLEGRGIPITSIK